MEILMENNAVISYCIPVMNRFEDIEGTLLANLEVAKKFAGRVNIHLACFDDNDQVENYIKAHCQNALLTGLLQFHRLKPLPYWHFCWAKNSFKRFINGEYYSSLDGDNFITEEEVQQTLDLVSSNTIIHHFSGNWGDGTSGRITIPTWLYREVGYDHKLMSRQYDEISLILHSLNRYPELTLVSNHGVDLKNLSKTFPEFCEVNDFSYQHKEVEFPPVKKPPLNARGGNYVTADPKMRLLQNANAYYTFLQLAQSAKAERFYTDKFDKAIDELIRSDQLASEFEKLFLIKSGFTVKKSDELTVYSVIKDDLFFLENWLNHYRAMGVKRFVLIDDDSKKPLTRVFNDPDIMVCKPRVGDFKNFKRHWIKACASMLQQTGSWMVTVDSDEFVDPPKGYSTLANYVSDTKASHKQIFGLLIDLLPDSISDSKVTTENYIETMTHCFCRPRNESYRYQDYPSIKWAFGDNWPVSFAFDIRWRLFGTFDSLRKFCLVRFEPSMMLNQGFHSVKRGGNEVNPKIVAHHITPVRHYKFVKKLADHTQGFAASAKNYHARTSGNLQRIAETGLDFMAMTWDHSAFKYPYEDIYTLFERAIRESRISKRHSNS
ncbi:hypothetical protein CWE25_11870 [Idiomarina fontislapidosi]|uniref:Uncharacterized protein n=2 Tax=Idiomarina fontislapidosi TaxID=263723 RepID=A0A432XQU0_9GAMM|nr:hypothetical protein CWE25_11870 [Idiomarina fontislapidosi]